MDNYFHFNIFRKTTIQFLNIFNNIKIAKYNSNGSVKSYYKVPLKYAPKQKFFYWLYERKHEVRLPVMAGFITDVSPAINERGTNKNIILKSCDGKSIHKNLIPITINYQLSISSLYLSEIDQIIEQILPYFSPYVITQINIPELNNSFDCKVILDNISPEEDVEIPEDNYRTINWNLDFTVHSYILQPMSESKYIETININFKDNDNNNLYETVSVSGEQDLDGNIITSFEIKD